MQPVDHTYDADAVRRITSGRAWAHVFDRLASSPPPQRRAGGTVWCTHVIDWPAYSVGPWLRVSAYWRVPVRWHDDHGGWSLQVEAIGRMPGSSRMPDWALPLNMIGPRRGLRTLYRAAARTLRAGR